MPRIVRRTPAFSLIELLIAVAILMVLAAIVLPRYLGGKDPISKKKIVAPRERAQQAAGVEYVGQINQAIQMYRMDHDGENPPSLADLKPYGVLPQMMVDQTTRQPLPYDPRTGTVGRSNGPDSLGGGANLPQIGQ